MTALTYAAARQRFLHTTSHAGGLIVDTIASPHTGPDGDGLFVDVAQFGPADATAVLVLNSGTHGVEGHAGSLVQSHLMSALLSAGLPSGVATFLIHAVNPYGFAWDRRVTEEGVDLNRNFIDFSRPLPTNDEFDDHLAAILTPADRATTDPDLLAWLTAKGPQARHIIARGQYQHPYAPFFGGTSPSWARTTYEDIITAQLSAAQRVCVIDYHTGLGPTGHSQMIGSTSPHPDTDATASALWGQAYVPAGGAGSVSYTLDGDLVGATARLCPNTECVGAAQEFGTLDEWHVLGALRDDHAAAHPGGPGRDEKTRAAMREAFYCDTAEWTKRICDAAEDSAISALRWLAGTPAAIRSF